MKGAIYLAVWLLSNSRKIRCALLVIIQTNKQKEKCPIRKHKSLNVLILGSESSLCVECNHVVK